MRILIVSNLYPPTVMGGYELACSQAAEGLARLCHEVMVLTSQPGVGPAPERRANTPLIERSLALAPVFDSAQVQAHPLSALQALEARSQWIDGHNAGAVIDAVERFQPDVIYLWNLVGIGGLGLLMALRVMKAPWVWHLCDRVPFQLCSERGILVPALAEAFGRLVEGRWITLSDQLRMEIANLGVPLRGPVTKLPLWVQTEGVPLRLPEPGQRPLQLAFAGQVASHKGADLAVEAAIELHRQGMDISLDLWGEVLELPLLGRAAAAGLGDRIVFHGATDHAGVLEGIAGCDVLLFPTWPREPFGIVPAEAAAVGTPPILSECGAAEWLVDGVHAVHVPRTVEGLVDAVQRIDRGEIDLVQLARQAASRVRSDLLLESILPSIERELQEAARPGRSSSPDARRAFGLSLIADRLVGDIVEKRWV